MEKEKITLSFIAEAAKKAQKDVEMQFDGTNCVSATRNVTCFEKNREVVCLPGCLHEKVECQFCVEFDIRFNYGNAVIVRQRIY